MAKILAVDDALVMRNLMSAVLEGAGHTVKTAKDGFDAMEAVRTGSFDLIITDINMPNMSGMSLLTKIRCQKKYTNTPIIMITTESSDYKKDRAKQSGADGWLQKPVTEDRILKAVNTMLTAKKCA